MYTVVNSCRSFEIQYILFELERSVECSLIRTYLNVIWSHDPKSLNRCLQVRFKLLTLGITLASFGHLTFPKLGTIEPWQGPNQYTHPGKNHFSTEHKEKAVLHI